MISSTPLIVMQMNNRDLEKKRRNPANSSVKELFEQSLGSISLIRISVSLLKLKENNPIL